MSVKLKTHKGFTLIELSVVLMILAALAVVSTRFMFDEFDRSIADKTVAEMWAVAEYSIAYYAENSSWPGESGDCTNAAQIMDSAVMLQGLKLKKTGTVVNGILSPWFNDNISPAAYQSYDLSCDKNNPYAGFSIALDIPDFPGGVSGAEWAQFILQKLPLSKTGSTSSTVILTMPAPAGVVALRDYLLRTDDPKRNAMNSSGKQSLNDLDADINLNDNVIYDFDVGDRYDSDGNGTINNLDDFFTKSQSLYRLDMDNTSVFSNIVLIPEPSVLPVLDPSDPLVDYGEENCRDRSPGGFTLEICEKNFSDIDDAIKYNHPTAVYGSSIKNVKSQNGSVKANDIYLKSVDMWGSQIFDTINPLRILEAHYQDKYNSNLITAPTCKTGYVAYYEIWPKMLCTQNTHSCSYTPPGGILLTDDFTYKKHHFFMSGNSVSIKWDEGEAAGGIVAPKCLTLNDSCSSAFVNVYCEKS